MLEPRGRVPGRPERLLVDDGDRLLGAVVHRPLRERDVVLGLQLAGAARGRVAVLVDLEHAGRHRVAAVVALALLGVDLDLFRHAGNTTIILRGPRTCPPAHVTASGSSSLKSGMRFSQSWIDTFIAMRARFEPAQRWMPTPEAMCGFFARSRSTTCGFSNTRGSRFAAGKFISTLLPSGIGQPLYSVSFAT